MVDYATTACGHNSPDEQLLKFYGATDYPSLVAAMEHHIAKLQARDTTPPVLVRDVAEIIGSTVPDVCKALADAGHPPRSTNMAISGEEAVEVAQMLRSQESAEPDGWALVDNRGMVFQTRWRQREVLGMVVDNNWHFSKEFIAATEREWAGLAPFTVKPIYIGV